MSQVLNLYRLQKIDSQKDQVSQRLNVIDKILQQNEAIQAAQERYHTAQINHSEAQKKLNTTEEQVKNQLVKIELSETALYGGKVHNPKELQDLQNELASLKRYLVTLEDHQLEAMLFLEEREAGLKQSTNDLDEVLRTIGEQQKNLIAERDQLLRDLDRYQAERQAAASAIPENFLQIYEKLRSQRRGIAVATIDDETCSACGSTLTPAERQLARSPSQISYCSTCGRILYAG
ncbi:MAG TPA: C4-type zinc ribbon domain-containing protein [Anaerolineaceae bacterium]|nr:C4-type zinc ribbon domain-containing protein [Anaerolineaceae bacterium]